MVNLNSQKTAPQLRLEFVQVVQPRMASQGFALNPTISGAFCCPGVGAAHGSSGPQP